MAFVMMLGGLVAASGQASDYPNKPVRLVVGFIPTMAEAGMPNFDTSIWFGLMAPNGAPKEIAAKLEKALKEAQGSAEVQASLKASGFDTISGGPNEFANMMQSEIKRWSEVATAAGLKK